MHSSTNRSNHDFQIAFFLIGACHTPDAAYALLCDLHEGRDNAIKCFEASKMREKAKRIRAMERLTFMGKKITEGPLDEAMRLEAEADICEIEAMTLTMQKNYDAAIAERNFIEKCMAALEPHRKYKDLTLPEAHEACQQEEWKFELINRAENMLITAGSISPEQFGTMRMHPEFETAILPVINSIQTLQMELRNPDATAREIAVKGLTDITTKRRFELPELPALLTSK